MQKSSKPPVKLDLRHILAMDMADVASLPALYRRLIHVFRFFVRVVIRFIADQCIQRASALAYASLLAIVPMVVLGFSVFTSFQAFESMAGSVSNALLDYLLPTSQQAVQDYLGTVAEGSTTLSVFGIIGLLFVATALLNTIEEAFNDIWRITRARAWLSKFVIFWATLTLAPILIGASISITSYFTALPILKEVAEGASYISEVPFVLPWLMSSLAMACLYAVLPNTPVPFRYAAMGGMVAGALFEWTKIGFAYYVTEIADYEMLYGALSTLPVFLLWIYVVWIVVLLGSEITFCLQHPEQSHRQQSSFQKPGVRQFFSHFILLRAAQAHHAGDTLLLDDLIEETDVPNNILQEWLDQLSDRGLLRSTIMQSTLSHQHEESGWILGFDLDSMNLNDIFQHLNDVPMDVPEVWQESTLGRHLTGVYFRLERERTALLQPMTMRDFLQRQQEEEAARDDVLKGYDS